MRIKGTEWTLKGSDIVIFETFGLRADGSQDDLISCFKESEKCKWGLSLRKN